jgi:hypothetical protein
MMREGEPTSGASPSLAGEGDSIQPQCDGYGSARVVPRHRPRFGATVSFCLLLPSPRIPWTILPWAIARN